MAQGPGDTVATVSSRINSEIQSALVIAKKFPRDEARAWNKILTACKRPSLAEHAIYSYSRGGNTIEGPTIRLLETVARYWGNIEYGLIEVERTDTESRVMAYAWDLETNTKRTILFTVEHVRVAKNDAGVKVSTKLVDPRDVYEMMANFGSRRVRACLEGVIPDDIVESARAECENTILGGAKADDPDQIKKILAGFAGLGVTGDEVAEYLGHPTTVVTPAEQSKLRKLYAALRDGMVKREDAFPKTVKAKESNLAKAKKEKEPAKEPEPEKAKEPGDDLL